MSTPLSLVTLNETSYHVTLLHQTLAILGLPVAQLEVEGRRAGLDTRKRVRALQARLGVRIDDATLVDGATLTAIADELKRQGLLDASRSFIVAGTTRNPDGSARKRQRLVAFDVDLRGVAVYRDVKGLADIARSRGFECLGSTVSDIRGAYRLTFYDWQYQRAERGKADVVVYAVEGHDDKARIVGRSRLVRSEDYLETGLVDGVDVSVEVADALSEYEAVMGRLNPLLAESGIGLREIARSREQLAFAASELEIAAGRITAAAHAAQLVAGEKEEPRQHELLYGIGRQQITLDWAVLYKRTRDELRDAIARSVTQQIIGPVTDKEVDAFLDALRPAVAKQILDHARLDGKSPLATMLAVALPDDPVRVGFLHALSGFTGSDFSTFWTTHLPAQPEFRGKPELVANLLFARQLTFLSGHHPALVEELQGVRKLGSVDRLFDLTPRDWLQVVLETGVPPFVEGRDDAEKARRYAATLQGALNAAFPTKRIARMAANKELPIEEPAVADGVSAFLEKAGMFDIATSRVHDFEREIQAAAGEHAAGVRRELLKMQRVFQVSPGPEVMTALMERNLHSAFTIASIPRKSFLKTYGKALGGETTAATVHQRASHIAAKSEIAGMHILEYSQGLAPRTVIDTAEHDAALAVVQNHLPNYGELFGSPDVCECDQCRSVHSAAAYFVDLLRFLWRGEPNALGNTPLDVLAGRRPDLLHLPLTCENTNTPIPYIDLANEVMEYYAAHDSLASFRSHDTGDATAAELRANAQHFELEAYRRVNDASYPFTLPYHQPLDVIRTFGDHLKVSRHEVMRAVSPLPGATSAQAIAAETLRLSQEEHEALTGTAFDGTPDNTPVHRYFGLGAAELDSLGAVPELLQRTGVSYPDLVALVQTRFLNLYQGTLRFLQGLFSSTLLTASALYTRLGEIEAGSLDPADDAEIMAAIAAYNAERGTNLTAGEFQQWVVQHLAEFRQVITLHEPDSKCSLGTTRLRTLQSLYESSAASGVTPQGWSRVHRFIRLWRKLGWTIHETDLMLVALGYDDITAATIASLASVVRLAVTTKLPLNQLAVLWGGIDTNGRTSLYKRLFLNRAVHQLDPAFKPNVWGDYLQNPNEVLGNHQSAIRAAFRIREEDLTSILGIARVVDGGVARALDLDTDILDLGNLSTIYRYVVVANALTLRVPDLCTLVRLFGMSPFSQWNIQQSRFTSIAPERTQEFYQLAETTKKAGFKASVLEYILEGTRSPDAAVGLAPDKVRQAVKAIRALFAAIDRDFPATPAAPLTVEALTAKLALTFAPEVVSRFIGILDGTATFEAIAAANLNIVMPAALSAKYTYIRGSARLIAIGVVTDDELPTLRGLSNDANYVRAVDELYAAPETFLRQHFESTFGDLAAANATLLDHPAQPVPAALEARLAYVYGHFVPILKGKLRRDALTQHLAALIGLSEEATAVLVAGDVDALIDDLSAEGFSATYFNDPAWTNAASSRTDPAVDFAWGAAAPDPAVGADNFSVRWEAYIAALASAEYTLRVDVADADEVFRLDLDDIRILEKAAAHAITSFEAVATLNASQMHRLRLEYAEAAQNAAVRLRWKTATNELAVVPPSAAYPAAVVDNVTALVTRYHRAAQLISGFALSESELDHLIQFAADFGGIDFTALTADDWKRVCDYVTLRNAVPQAQARLTELFARANRSSPAPTPAELRELLHRATAWDETSLQFLVGTHFALGVNAFRNEIALNRVREVMQIVAKTGLSAETVATWGAVETGFDALNDTAQLIKNTVKAKYEDADWLQLAGELSDKVRTHQRQALVAYLLTQPAIRAWGATDADALFEYFLIDVQMGACLETSRIVQANASIQMFVNRCLLNLESVSTPAGEGGVSPGAIDRDRWEWMKQYRVWEANRKVFLYPENWLEPEWRNDRSAFFRELESYLVQNDVTERSVEQAFRNYLTSLNEVANLDVCGLHRENFDNGQLKYLHVFARTHNAPYKYFYRRWNQHRKWSPWERVPVDIRSIEAGPANSGLHVLPVVWKKRLFVFWPEFIETQEATQAHNNKKMEDLGDEKLSSLKQHTYWEIRLAWSEHADGRWTPKQVTSEFVRVRRDFIDGEAERHISFSTSISATTQALTISLWNKNLYPDFAAFILSDIQSKVQIWYRNYFLLEASEAFSDYAFAFQKRTKTLSPVTLADDTYLQNALTHETLEPSNLSFSEFAEHALQHPFFFGDAQRTYFVRPVDITIIQRIRNPGHATIELPDRVNVRRDPVPDIPDVEPDDRFPGGRPPIARPMRAGSAGGSALMDIASTGPAFRGSDAELGYLGTQVRFDKGLEFHTFYHPYSSTFVRGLNQRGVPGLMDQDTELPSDNGTTFESVYRPNFTHGFVQKPADFAARTYYKENVCFDVYGANSLYNWELFFHAPLYIATRLSRNGRYEEAMRWFHYIFDPTTDATPGPGESPTSRYWKFLPLKSTPAESLEEWFRSLGPNGNPDVENAIIGEWRDYPFDPHRVAANRPLAYMKHVVIAYVQNVIAWGDSLFRQFTMESVNEALQLYVIANHILGPRPEFVPARAEVKAESYATLENRWDDFSNALVALENIFPYSSDASVSTSSTGTSLLGIGTALYFCIPPNEKLMDSWNTVADRLYKIRHCQDIDGVERRLALFAPPIDPAALVQATSQGLSLGSILADLSSPPPIYRFTTLIDKAHAFCADVKALGTALLAALEKKDAEELGRLRASQETQMLELITAVRERQVLEATANKASFEKAREAASFRLQHYIDLLGNEAVTVPAVPTLSATLTADSALPADTAIATIQTDVDDALADSDETGIKLIPREARELELSQRSADDLFAALAGEIVSGFLGLIPQFDAEGTPLGVGAGAGFGGRELGWFAGAMAKTFAASSQINAIAAAKSSRVASYIRREQDWTLQANLAAREIVQLDKQITAADIRLQIARKELAIHTRQIEDAQAVEQFLQDKFTNQELYQWMKEQLFAVYKQSYNLAFDMAKKAEKAYRHEMGTELASFVQYGYWDNSQQGLVAGEKLQLGLRQLERSYLDENRRELELTKNVSLARLNPLALIQLRETGTCFVSLPEELFDLDFRGHYFRRIKSVRLSIPCIAGPYTSVGCSLRLLTNSVRLNTAMNSGGHYEHEHDEGLWIDDDRFRTTHVPVTAIATSFAQNDAGMLEFNLRDERYLPFERAGVISDWHIELSTDRELRPFDYTTIADVILHINYTARESGGLFKDRATAYIKDFIANTADLAEQPLMQMYAMKHEFATEWHRFLHPGAAGAEQILRVTPGHERFPFFAHNRDIVVMQVDVFARSLHAITYHLLVSYTDANGNAVTSNQITMPQSAAQGGLNRVTLNTTDAGLNLADLDVAAPMTLRLKRSTAPDYTALVTDPEEELKEVYLVVHYKLA